MTIRITAPNTFEGDEPIVGRDYSLTDVSEGTAAQNAAFHGLVSAYWVSGAHSYTAKTYDEFRNQIKRSLGAGFESYLYACLQEGKAVVREVGTFAEIPKGIRIDPDFRQMIRGRLKSWSKYTKRERTDTIDRLIAEMHAAGVNTMKFHEILAGMEEADDRSRAG